MTNLDLLGYCLVSLNFLYYGILHTCMVLTDTVNMILLSRTVTKGSVLAVVGYTAEIPCELTPKAASDAPTLILWYKDIFGTPIYRYVDTREAHLFISRLQS